MNLGQAVYLYRVENGLSQKEFADMCGLTNVTISSIERNKKPSKITEAKIKSIIGINDDKDIVDKMITYRAVHRLTQPEFAKLCGIAPQTVYSIERREQKPRTKTLKKLLEMLGGE